MIVTVTVFASTDVPATEKEQLHRTYVAAPVMRELLQFLVDDFASDGDVPSLRQRAAEILATIDGEPERWCCAFCHTSNGAADRHCVNCGRKAVR